MTVGGLTDAQRHVGDPMFQVAALFDKDGEQVDSIVDRSNKFFEDEVKLFKHNSFRHNTSNTRIQDDKFSKAKDEKPDPASRSESSGRSSGNYSQEQKQKICDRFSAIFFNESPGPSSPLREKTNLTTSQIVNIFEKDQKKQANQSSSKDVDDSVGVVQIPARECSQSSRPESGVAQERISRSQLLKMRHDVPTSSAGSLPRYGTNELVNMGKPTEDSWRRKSVISRWDDELPQFTAKQWCRNEDDHATPASVSAVQSGGFDLFEVARHSDSDATPRVEGVSTSRLDATAIQRHKFRFGCNPDLVSETSVVGRPRSGSLDPVGRRNSAPRNRPASAAAVSSTTSKLKSTVS